MALTLFKKEIIVLAADVTGGPLTDFPLLVSITDSDLQKNARPDGFDIFFTRSDGITVLPYDRESYDSVTGELIAWVLVDLSDTDDNTFFMFYGNPDQTTDQQDPLPVWNTRFEDIFHFNQTSPLPWVNSSVGKNFTTQPTGDGPITPVGGQIDTASNSSVSSVTATLSDFRMTPTVDVFPTDFFASVWVKYDTIAGGGSGVFYDTWSPNQPIVPLESGIVISSGVEGLVPDNSIIILLIDDSGFTEIPIGDMSDLAYHHVAVRYLSGTFDLFFDGSFVSSTPYAFGTPPNFDAAQCGGGGGSAIQSGRIDQLQVAYTANFTNGFITTSFDNQKTTGQGAGNFVKVGVQQITTISNNYLLLSQGAISEKESSSIINAVCGDSNLLIGDVVRLLPVGTGEGFTQSDDLLPRVGIVDETGTASYGIIIGGDFEGVYSEGEINVDSNGLAKGIIASFFGDGIRVCTQGRCLAFANGKAPINIGDKLTSSENGLVKAFGTDQVIAIALQAIDTPTTDDDDMLYEDLEIMQYEDLITMIYELSVLSAKNSIIAVDVQRSGPRKV